MNTNMGFSLIKYVANLNPEISSALSEMQSPLFFFICFQLLLLSMIFGSFILSFATTMGLHFFGGKGSFRETYRVLACSWVTLLVSWIPFIGIFLALYTFVIAWFGLAKVHEVPGWKGIVSMLGGSLTVTFSSLALCFILAGMLSTLFPRHLSPTEDAYERAPRELLDQYEKR